MIIKDEGARVLSQLACAHVTSHSSLDVHSSRRMEREAGERSDAAMMKMKR